MRPGHGCVRGQVNARGRCCHKLSLRGTTDIGLDARPVERGDSARRPLTCPRGGCVTSSSTAPAVSPCGFIWRCLDSGDRAEDTSGSQSRMAGTGRVRDQRVTQRRAQRRGGVLGGPSLRGLDPSARFERHRRWEPRRRLGRAGPGSVPSWRRSTTASRRTTISTPRRARTWRPRSGCSPHAADIYRHRDANRRLCSQAFVTASSLTMTANPVPRSNSPTTRFAIPRCKPTP